MSGKRPDKNQKSFMLVFEPKSNQDSAKETDPWSTPRFRVGYSVDKVKREKLKERLIRELTDFGS